MTNTSQKSFPVLISAGILAVLALCFFLFQSISTSSDQPVRVHLVDGTSEFGWIVTQNEQGIALRRKDTQKTVFIKWQDISDEDRVKVRTSQMGQEGQPGLPGTAGPVPLPRMPLCDPALQTVIPREYFGLEAFSQDILNEIHQMGVGIIGLNNINWNYFEPTPPENGQHVYTWEKLDAVAAALSPYGLHLQIICKPNPPPWAANSTKTLKKSEATHIPQKEYWQDWGLFIQALVERYDGDGVDDAPGIRYPVLRIVSISVEIEVMKHFTKNGGSPEIYHELLRIAYQAAKQASCHVLIGRAAFNYGKRGEFGGEPFPDIVAPEVLKNDKKISNAAGYLNASFKQPEIMDLFGVHANHHYSSMPSVAEWLRSNTGGYVSVYSEDTRSNLFALEGEKGWDKGLDQEVMDFIAKPNLPQHTEIKKRFERDQAITVAKKLVCGLAANYSHVIISGSFDWPTYHIKTWRRAGLFEKTNDKTFNPKPGVYAYTLIANTLTGADRKVETLSYSQDLCVFEFTKNGASIYVAWSDVGASFDLPVSPARVTFLPVEPGKTTPKTEIIQTSSITLTDLPVIIQNAQ